MPDTPLFDAVRGRFEALMTQVNGSGRPRPGWESHWNAYRSDGFFDEMMDLGRPREASAGVVKFLASLGEGLLDRQRAADVVIQAMGITFTVYSETDEKDRAWPFDVIPRIIAAQEWDAITEGLIQRLTALNMFI